MSIKQFYDKHPKLSIIIGIFFGLIFLSFIGNFIDSDSRNINSYGSYDKYDLVNCREGKYDLMDVNEEDSYLEVLDNRQTCDLLLHKKNGSVIKKEYCSFGCMYQLEEEWITDQDRYYRQCCIKTK